MDDCRRPLSVDNYNLHGLRDIRKLFLQQSFPRYPQVDRHPDRPSYWTDWLIMCNTLAAMANLRYLEIDMNLGRQRAGGRTMEENEEMARTCEVDIALLIKQRPSKETIEQNMAMAGEFLQPLMKVQASMKRHFPTWKNDRLTVIARRWGLPEGFDPNLPVRFIVDERKGWFLPQTLPGLA